MARGGFVTLSLIGTGLVIGWLHVFEPAYARGAERAPSVFRSIISAQLLHDRSQRCKIEQPSTINKQNIGVIVDVCLDMSPPYYRMALQKSNYINVKCNNDDYCIFSC